MNTKEQFKDILLSLIQKFEKEKHHYLSKGYLEAQVRQDFIDPMFEALGWDIENEKGLSPFERDVILEKGETTGRPDYNFRIDGSTKFFIEAKAPSVALNNINHILQAKDYAWNTKEVYFVILTDFEEFKLFDASLKPDPRHPTEGLIFDFKYFNYLTNIDKLWLLSREEVERGSLEALLPRDVKSKRLRIPVDRAFLEDMTTWRVELAKDIHKRNPELDVKLLNEVVQKLLDRIIFIRIAEDRKIRDPNELKEIVEVWKLEGKRKPLLTHLKDLFAEVNADLNGDIFKPHACETIFADSNLLADIIENLYFPKCRYRFDVIGVELLGSIYERYLGSTIRVTPQRVKVEEKPEVRKAGGVYYTPQFIVDYIVKNTIGRLIAGKTPKQIEKIKILDPACGSGSFLLGAYQYLLNYHLEYYRYHPQESQTLFLDFYFKFNPEDLSLPIYTKAKILKNNIFGVDIDPQAVEITMMSLYLKALEGERGLLPKKQQLLPSLNGNIKCGNSLIGYDVLEQGDLFDDESKSLINPFDWNSKKAGFGEIMENGGFDVVIGNPPYVRIQTLPKKHIEYFNRKYCSAIGNYDIYVLFVEKALQLLKEQGIHGYILPHKFFQASYGQGLRDLISQSKSLMEIINFRDNQVFDGASTYTCLLFLSRNRAKDFKYAEFIRFSNPSKQLNKVIESDMFSNESMRVDMLPKKQASSPTWNFCFKESATLINKLKKYSRPLEELTDRIFQGLKTSADKIYIMDIVGHNGDNIVVHSQALDKDFELESDLLKPLLKGGQMRRYFIEDTSKAVLFPYDSGKLIAKKVFQERYPLCWSYLCENKKYLENRESGKMKGENWYAYGRTQALEVISLRKIITPDIASSASYCFDEDGKYYFTGGAAGGYGLLTKEIISPKYLLALLNSSLLDWYHHQNSTNFRGGYFSYESRFIKNLPIRTIDFQNSSEKAIYDEIISLVDRMIELHKKKNSLPLSVVREKVEREIAVAGEKIEDIVCRLYGITEKERRSIEDK